jgi:ribosomal protein S18 acetylase RimI-like enzyme
MISTILKGNLFYYSGNYTFASQTVEIMKFVIEYGTSADIDELEKLYDDLNDYLSATTNYPGWIKGIYPVRENAVAGIEDNTLFVVRHNGKIVGSVILDHHPDEAYNNVRWKIDADYSRIFVIRTFVVHPSFLKMGIGRTLMDYSFELAQQSGIKSIRLDVYENNLPAISLYEKCGFKYIDTVDLGFGNYGLDWFKLYEKLV